MANRNLYIAAYDISSPSRLRRALHVVKGYASGGQKSVFECYLTEGERLTLLEALKNIVDPQEDRFMLLPLADPTDIQVLGRAVRPIDPDFYYVG